MDEIDTDAEFCGSEFDSGIGYAWFGRSLEQSIASIERELDRPLRDHEREAFAHGWHVGRADYEAAREREAARQWADEQEQKFLAEMPPETGDPIPF